MCISCEPGLEVIGEAPDADAAVELAGALRPDVVVMDLHLGESTGFEATRRIVAALPGSRVVVHSMTDDPHSRALAAEAGALAFVGKQEGPDRLTEVIRHLASDTRTNYLDTRSSPVTEGPASK